MQQTKHSVLEQVYKTKEVRDVLKFIKREDLREDILQHVFLELLEKPEPFILDLFNRGKLRSYIVSSIYNTSYFTHSTFAKQLGKETPTDFANPINSFLSETDDVEYIAASNHLRSKNSGYLEPTNEVEQSDDRLWERETVKAMEGLHWYSKKIFELYMELGTIRQVSEHLGIPKSSIHKTITEVRNKVRKIVKSRC